jgi:hypothetical protein
MVAGIAAALGSLSMVYLAFVFWLVAGLDIDEELSPAAAWGPVILSATASLALGWLAVRLFRRPSRCAAAE